MKDNYKQLSITGAFKMSKGKRTKHFDHQLGWWVKVGGSEKLSIEEVVDNPKVIERHKNKTSRDKVKELFKAYAWITTQKVKDKFHPTEGKTTRLKKHPDGSKGKWKKGKGGKISPLIRVGKEINKGYHYLTHLIWKLSEKGWTSDEVKGEWEKHKEHLQQVMEQRGYDFIPLGDKPPVIEVIITRKEETLEDVCGELWPIKKDKKKAK